MTDYSIKLGLWKTIKNTLVVLSPAIISFLAQLPDEVTVKYAMPIGFIVYFVKNYIQVKKE
jgi:hypothetical protein